MTNAFRPSVFSCSILNKKRQPKNMTEKGDPFFMDDLGILLTPGRLIEFYPTSDQTIAERMNAIARLIIYVSVALSVYKSNASPARFGAVVLLGLIVIWRAQTLTTRGITNGPMGGVADKFGVLLTDQVRPVQLPCTMPTKENPFMNPLYGDPPNKPPACRGPGVQEMAANLLDQQLFEDVEDLYSRAQMQRQFYTLPSTTIPQEREKFADYLFRDYPNCKTNGGDCVPSTDLRLQRDVVIDPQSTFESNLFGQEYNVM